MMPEITDSSEAAGPVKTPVEGARSGSSVETPWVVDFANSGELPTRRS
jgi:hypothetical protein